MDAYAPIFLLAGGEIFRAAIGLRVAVWVRRGGREWRASAPAPRPGGPGGPPGGLRVIQGGARPAPLRRAA